MSTLRTSFSASVPFQVKIFPEASVTPSPCATVSQMPSTCGPSGTTTTPSATTTAAPILGPILGGLISDNMSWHWIFFINLPVVALCGLIVVVAGRARWREVVGCVAGFAAKLALRDNKQVAEATGISQEGSG